MWWQDHGGKVDTCGYISLDGITVPGRFLLGEGIASRSGARADPYRERPFKFMEVPENSAQAHAHLHCGILIHDFVAADGAADSNADAGTIVLKIRRVRRVEDTEANAVEVLPDSVLTKRKPGDLCVGCVSTPNSWPLH